MKTSKRIIAIIVCVLFVLAASLSMAFLVEHAGHSCRDDWCEVCLHITQITNAFKHAKSPLILAVLAIAALSAAFAYVCDTKNLPGTGTSVSLKVQLNH